MSNHDLPFPWQAASGPVLESYGYRAACAFAALPAAMVLLPVAMGCLQEQQLSTEESRAVTSDEGRWGHLGIRIWVHDG